MRIIVAARIVIGHDRQGSRVTRKSICMLVAIPKSEPAIPPSRLSRRVGGPHSAGDLGTSVPF